MTVENIREKIVNGETALGIELGSTRIKGVLLTSEIETIAVGSYGWENKLENGVWTYDLAEAWKGVQTCFANLAQEVKTKYDVELKRIGSIGISAMMHGYLAFDANVSEVANNASAAYITPGATILLAKQQIT